MIMRSIVHILRYQARAEGTVFRGPLNHRSLSNKLAGARTLHRRRCTRRVSPRIRPKPIGSLFPNETDKAHALHYVPTTTNQQLRNVMLHSAIPMVGFGLMDQTVMLQAGNAIDCSIGVTLQLSTLAAAAVGQIFANAGGILFGETLQQLTSGIWALPKLTGAQWASAAVRRAKFLGTFAGLLVGGTLGLLNLWIIDTDRSSTLKLRQALDEEGERREFAYEIKASNRLPAKDKQPATTLTIRGPDVDGLLASVVTVLAEEGCSLVELNAKPREGNGSIDDVFVIRRQGAAIPNEDLEDLAKKLFKATKSPLSVPTLAAKNKELELETAQLRVRVGKLLREIEKRQIDVVPSNLQ